MTRTLLERKTGDVLVFENNCTELLKTIIAKIHNLVKVVWNCIANKVEVTLENVKN